MNSLVIENLSIRLGESDILSNVSFQLQEGDFLVVIGPNGAGKTTLLNSLLGLVPPSRGSVRVFEQPPDEVPPSSIGYVPQVKTLDRNFPALAIELVISGLRHRWPSLIGGKDRAAAIDALKQVGADHLAGRPLGWLSGGELQRVYLARSFVRQPRLIILDEPATGIDLVGATDMYRILEGYRSERNATILMVTHDWGAAYHHASHALVLNRQIISFGKPQEALSDEILRRAFGHVGHLHTMHTGECKHD
jgi:zinc transport system ATP-binding protein